MFCWVAVPDKLTSCDCMIQACWLPLTPALYVLQIGLVSLYFAWYLLYIYRAFHQLRMAPYSTFRLGHLMLRLQVREPAAFASTGLASDCSLSLNTNLTTPCQCSAHQNWSAFCACWAKP